MWGKVLEGEILGYWGPALKRDGCLLLNMCQVRPDQICDLLQVPCKPVQTCFVVGLLGNKPSPPPGFLVGRVYGYGHSAGLKTKPVRGQRRSL